MARNYAAIPYEYLEELQDLTDEEFGKIARALLLYSSENQDIDFEDRSLRIVWRLVKAGEDRMRESYDNACEKNRKNGAKGGRPKTENAVKEPTETQENPNNPIRTEQIQNRTDIEKRVKERKRFTAPSPLEVDSYCAENGLVLTDYQGHRIDGQSFCDHYAASGWKLKGGTPMKDWRAAVRNWARKVTGTVPNSSIDYRELDKIGVLPAMLEDEPPPGGTG